MVSQKCERRKWGVRISSDLNDVIYERPLQLLGFNLRGIYQDQQDLLQVVFRILLNAGRKQLHLCTTETIA